MGNVLVLGDNDLAGLATVRSLGRAGHAVSLVAFEPSPITCRSRYVRKVHRLGHPLEAPGPFIGGLLGLLTRRHFDLVLPTSDKVLVPLMPWRAELEKLTRLAAPDSTGFHKTHRKDETVLLARRLGVPVPATQILTETKELAELPRSRQFPLVLKPSCSVQPGTLVRNEVVIVRSEVELQRRLPALLRRCPVLVQEFCPGQGVGLTVLARRGEVFAAFQHQRLHEPPEGGVSSYRKSVPLCPVLLDHARRMCADLRWTGPAMFEFKVDPATGSAVLMEINGRLWGSLVLAIQAGVDFPRLLYDLLVHDRATPTFHYKAPYHVRHTTRDLYWLRSNWQTPSGRKDLLRLSLGQVLKELGNIIRGREGYDLETLTDPLPAVMGWLQFVGEIARGFHWRAWQRWWQFCARRQARRVRARHPTVLRQFRQARSILFVCKGNLHRSAVAEQMLRQQFLDQPNTPRVASAGLQAEPGCTTGPVSRAAALELGVDLEWHRARPLTRAMLEEFDLVVVMEAAQLGAIRKAHPGTLHKTYLLSAFQADPGVLDIGDPDKKDREVFHQTYRMIEGCVAELARLWSAVPKGPQGEISLPHSRNKEKALEQDGLARAERGRIDNSEFALSSLGVDNKECSSEGY